MEFVFAGIILFGICLIFIIYYNGFIKLRNTVEEAYSTMDVYLKKRYDLIPNLVESVKGYAAHEKETLESVVSARNKAMMATTPEDRESSESMLTNSLKSLFALSEGYPELKADNQFLDLQKQLQKVEEDIAQSRKYYNAVVRHLNTKVEAFPSNIVAAVFGFKRGIYFTAEESERENVRFKF